MEELLTYRLIKAYKALDTVGNFLELLLIELQSLEKRLIELLLFCTSKIRIVSLEYPGGRSIELFCNELQRIVLDSTVKDRHLVGCGLSCRCH